MNLAGFNSVWYISKVTGSVARGCSSVRIVIDIKGAVLVLMV